MKKALKTATTLGIAHAGESAGIRTAVRVPLTSSPPQTLRAISSSRKGAAAAVTNAHITDLQATDNLLRAHLAPQPSGGLLLGRDHAEAQFRFAGCDAGQILHDSLHDHHVKQIFGSPNSLNVSTFDKIFTSNQFRTVLARHDQSSGHMAEGYARATGSASVAFVTSGSSLTNMVTPMQDALCDGTPMVVFCAEASHPSGFAKPQDVDVLGISESCTKWNVSIRDIADLQRRVNEAFEIACGGRPGPVLVHIPKSLDRAILTHPAPSNAYLKQRIDRGRGSIARPDPSNQPDQSHFKVARLVNMAKRPVIYAGQGMQGHPDGARILKEFADKTSIPVTTSLQGLGVFDELDNKALHMLGLHGSAYANLAIQTADLIIALGARFDDRVTGNIAKFAPEAVRAASEGRGGIVHFDIAPKNINKVVIATETVQGDCTINLSKLSALVDTVSERPEWTRQIEEWKHRYPLSAYHRTATQPQPGLIRAQAVIEQLSNMTNHIKDQVFVSTGVGQHQMWAAQHFRWRYPRTMVTSGGLGTMGYGLPAAIGVKLAQPDCLVIDIDGDASFNMTIAELATAAQHNIAVKVLLFNNEQMGMVSDLQRLYYQGRFTQNRQRNPDFVKASEAYGVAAQRCFKEEDVHEKLRWLLDAEGPAVLEVVTEQNSPVWPVVPAGKGLHEFVTYEEQALGSA